MPASAVKAKSLFPTAAPEEFLEFVFLKSLGDRNSRSRARRHAEPDYDVRICSITLFRIARFRRLPYIQRAISRWPRTFGCNPNLIPTWHRPRDYDDPSVCRQPGR